uniref:Peptide deformylase n=1 Tax=candidate division WOR-3 bacterium TaxID=2052148 RepID=A0A7C4U7D2_UNCW3
MTKRKIRIYPDPILKIVVNKVEKIDDNVRKIVKKMFKAMEEEDGIGLAANQMGFNMRIIVAKIPESPSYVFINPEIIEKEGEDIMEEGCLSFPGVSVNIVRASKIKVKGLNLDGKEIEQVFDGLIARVIQHEVDHLNGITIVDYLSPQEFLKFQRYFETILKEGVEKKGGL